MSEVVEFDTEDQIKRILNSESGKNAIRLLIRRDIVMTCPGEFGFKQFLQFVNEIRCDGKYTLRWTAASMRGGLEPIAEVLRLLQKEVDIHKVRRESVANVTAEEAIRVLDDSLGRVVV